MPGKSRARTRKSACRLPASSRRIHDWGKSAPQRVFQLKAVLHLNGLLALVLSDICEDRYILYHDHRFRGAIPGLWSRSWLPSSDRLRLVEDGVGFEPTEPLRRWKPRGSQVCKTLAISLSATRPRGYRSARPVLLERAFRWRASKIAK
jgi:hypothetical protein